MSQRPLIVLGAPRSGTSLVTRLCISAGYDPEIFLDSKFFGGSPHNPDGYHEEVRFTLLNDQLIRGVYGENYSFLFPPEFDGNKVASDLRDDFFYDLNEATLSIPPDFEKRIMHYTGSDFDYWGLTRMRQNEKWYNGYERFGVSNGIDIKLVLEKYSKMILEKRRVVIKDPRLCLTFNLLDFKNCDLVFVEREPQKIIKSMKGHYGDRLFSNKVFNKCNWVSNHFNLKVSPMSETTFLHRYRGFLEAIQNLDFRSFTINYDRIVSGDQRHITDFENFVSGEVNIDLINFG